MWAGGCAALALASNTDYLAICVLIIFTLYLTRADRKRQCLAGALLFLFELTAPLALSLIHILIEYLIMQLKTDLYMSESVQEVCMRREI